MSPLTVSGLSEPLATQLETAAAKAGKTVLAVPPGPLGSFPAQTLRPGSAVAVGYSSGDVRTSAVGTVVYVDGDKVWLFGHSLEGVGRRALLLQDAYVFQIINNPLQVGTSAATYKLAASGHDLGTVSDDGFSAVVGRTGPLPHTVPIQAIAHDTDTNAVSAVNASAADEAAVDLPSGGSWTSFIAPLAIAQATAGVLGNTPSRLTGEMCARITLAELKSPMRFCNRYVSVASGQADDGTNENAVMSGVSSDLGGALATIDAYTGKPPTVTGVHVLLKVHGGADQAFMRSVSLPKSARAGQKVAREGQAPGRPRRHADPHLQLPHPLLRASRDPDDPLHRPGRRPGRQRLHDDHRRRQQRQRHRRRRGPDDPEVAGRAGPRHRAATTASPCASARSAPAPSATTSTASRAPPRRRSRSLGAEAVHDARRRRGGGGCVG